MTEKRPIPFSQILKSQQRKVCASVGSEFLTVKRDCQRAKSVEKVENPPEERLERRKAMALVTRLAKEGEIREQKLTEIRRAKEELEITEATRLANTHYTNKASIKQLKSPKSASTQPTPQSRSPDPRRFSVKEGSESGIRLMSKPEKPVKTVENTGKTRVSKERIGEVVARLYPKKALSACHSEVQFGANDGSRAQTTLKVRSKSPITVTEIPLISLAAATPPMADLPTFEAAPPTVISTVKDRSESPNKGWKELASVDSPNLSSISNHVEEESFTRITAFDAGKSPEKATGERKERRPVSLIMGGGTGPQVTVPMAAYRFVVGQSRKEG